MKNGVGAYPFAVTVIQILIWSDWLWLSRPPASLPARRAYRPKGRAYASERGGACVKLHFLPLAELAETAEVKH